MFNTGLMNVAQEKYFYELKKLSSEDIYFLKNFVESISSGVIRDANYHWIDLFSFVHRFDDSVQKNGTITDELKENINELVKNLNENSHAFIEAQSKIYLDKLLNKDSSFYKSEKDRGKFLVFLVSQYTRTKKMKEEIINNAGAIKNINIENCIGVLSHIVTTTIAFNLLISPEYRTITFLENNTDLEFITSDQPIINLQVLDTPAGQPPKRLEFYYPISPELGILLSDEIDANSSNLTKEQVEEYNQSIVAFSFEQIFSSSKELLEKYSSQ